MKLKKKLKKKLKNSIKKWINELCEEHSCKIVDIYVFDEKKVWHSACGISSYALDISVDTVYDDKLEKRNKIKEEKNESI
jgi:hypothetical protein